MLADLLPEYLHPAYQLQGSIPDFGVDVLHRLIVPDLQQFCQINGIEDGGNLGQDGTMGVSRLFLCGAAHFCVVAAACGALAPDPEEMVSQLPPARDLDPAAAARLEDLSTEAMRLLDAGLFPAAEEAAQRALSLQPRAARPRAVLGRCLMERAEMDDPPDLRLWRRRPRRRHAHRQRRRVRPALPSVRW